MEPKEIQKAPDGAGLLRRYAQECRTLAYECADGIAPPFITDEFEKECGRCALGWVLHRTDPSRKAWDVFWDVQGALVAALGAMPERGPRSCSPDATVIDGNNKTSAQERHAACVFPLLWLADAVDEIASVASAPKGPQEASRGTP